MGKKQFTIARQRSTRILTRVRATNRKRAIMAARKKGIRGKIFSFRG